MSNQESKTEKTLPIPQEAETTGNKTVLETNILPLVKTNIMRILLPPELVQEINDHIDHGLQEKQDYAENLAGEIKVGEEIKLDPDHADLAGLREAYLESAEQYLVSYIRNTLTGNLAYEQNKDGAFSETPEIEIGDMWYNIYYEGDYNPIHMHRTHSKMGLSSFLFLKVPEHIGVHPTQKDGRPMNDGLTFFNYGDTSGLDFYDLVCTPSQVSIRPTIGELWLFPKWLEHGVYPFCGEGERRTLAANIDIWFSKPSEEPSEE